MVTTFTYKPSLVRIDARNFELSLYNRPTHPPTNRQDRLQYTAPQRARSVMKECDILGTGGSKHTLTLLYISPGDQYPKPHNLRPPTRRNHADTQCSQWVKTLHQIQRSIAEKHPSSDVALSNIVGLFIVQRYVLHMSPLSRTIIRIVVYTLRVGARVRRGFDSSEAYNGWSCPVAGRPVSTRATQDVVSATQCHPPLNRRLASASVHCAGSDTYQLTDPEPEP